MLIVGERINTSRKVKNKRVIETAVVNRNAVAIKKLATSQVEAGADYIDINAGTLTSGEPEALEWLTTVVMEAVTVPICFDTPNPEALARALAAYDVKRGQPFINSITAESARYATILPFVLDHKAKVIALAMDDTGIQPDAEKRLDVACKLVGDLAAAGVPLGDIYIDPLTFPIGSGDDVALAMMKVLEKIKTEFPGVQTIAGLSNVSHGMPARKILNSAMTILCLDKGLDAGILDPNDRYLMALIAASEALLGKDEYCVNYIRLHRKGFFDELTAAAPARSPIGSDKDPRSGLERLLRAGKFVVCGEMSPPQGADKAAILKKCSNFKGVVDAVNLTDNQTAIVRMSSVMSSVFALEGGVEPIMQMTCRDRNRLAQQSDILAAYAAGVRNLLCLSGDYMTFGNHPDAKGVFDLDSIQLIHTVAGMNAGKFLCGDEMKSPPRMFIGGAANPFAPPLNLRVMRLAKKIKAGAHFIQTQPVFDFPRFEKWLSAVRDEGLHEQVYILAGVMPVRSVKALLHMRDNVPGMTVADEYIQRMEKAVDPTEEGIAICVEIMKRLAQTPGISGIHIMPVMWESITPRLVEEAGLLPRISPANLPSETPPTEGIAP